MKTIFAVIALGFAGQAMAQTYVAPHTRSDGTFVQGHVRSAPNDTQSDNYSTSGNTNPYTGRAGTESPYNPNRR